MPEITEDILISEKNITQGNQKISSCVCVCVFAQALAYTFIILHVLTSTLNRIDNVDKLAKHERNANLYLNIHLKTCSDIFLNQQCNVLIVH